MTSSANDDEDAKRLPAGSATSLVIDKETRDLLARAGHPEAASGTLYYGLVAGDSDDTDRFFAVAMLDRQYFWTKQGRDGWRYQGDFDGRVCHPPVPPELYAQWGMSFSTPGGPSCAGG
ncbi:hypothetical protein [Nonomuraea sediminis]|uniref:hypothetical protein n=1 Tax=Nonomuraea sediminis TaxID=2835864 RepID=UPI001BDCA93C|nr:hypothetical protein [Nonomuraea sediminis]